MKSFEHMDSNETDLLKEGLVENNIPSFETEPVDPGINEETIINNIDEISKKEERVLFSAKEVAEKEEKIEKLKKDIYINRTPNVANVGPDVKGVKIEPEASNSEEYDLGTGNTWKDIGKKLGNMFKTRN